MDSIKVFSATVSGLDALPIEVEVDSTPGLHFFNIVGLPDKTVEESKDRIAAAIKNSGFIAPNQKNKRIIINLAPADIRKEGPGFDLPIAIGYLVTTGQIQPVPHDTLFIGEVSLDGSLRKIQGALPIALMAAQHGFKRLILPSGNASEASLADILIIPAQSISEVIGHVNDTAPIQPIPRTHYDNFFKDTPPQAHTDMASIKGQENAKRALVIAAAGGHNVLMSGPPGTGKTMLAKAFAGILPQMSYEEAVEVTKIYSTCGMLGNASLISQRPFRNPHHTTSPAAIIGGGSIPRPGEISLAHRGVLFLDEIPEFPRNVLESLRQPIENGEAVVSRAAGSVRFPAQFILVGAMNPCPCGNYGDELKACVCTAQAVYKYQKKISGPLLDRIDIQIQVSRETYDNITGGGQAASSKDLQTIVEQARFIQNKRFGGQSSATNAQMSSQEVETFCQLSPAAQDILKTAMISQGLSGRAYYKIRKLARTIADIERSEIIEVQHVAEAISYRIKESS